MPDPTEQIRAAATAQINRDGVPAHYDGPVWDTTTLQEEFSVIGFAAPCVFVTRRSDGVKGTLYFVHSPRVYFDFQES